MKFKQGLLFFALCLIAASAWLLDELLPCSLPVVAQGFVASVVVCLAAKLAGRRGNSRRLPLRSRFQIALWTAVLFSLPLILIWYAGDHLSATAVALCYTLVPAASAFFLAQAQEAELLSLLGPALAGIAGAALILPFELPGSTTGRLLLAALVCSAVLNGYAIGRLRTLTREASLAEGFCYSALGPVLAGATFLAIEPRVFATFHLRSFLLVSSIAHLVFSIVILALSLYLVRQISVVAFATRFLLVPFFTIVEGYVILRPENTWTLGLGVALIGFAVTMLLRESAFAENVLGNSHSRTLH